MRSTFVASFAFILILTPVAAAGFDRESIELAEWAEQTKDALNPSLIKAQVLLDRARFSPGEIDGKLGENVEKAIAAFASAQGLQATARLTEEVWQVLTATSQEPILTEYTISEEDTRGPFAEKIPAKMEDMQHLPALSYRSPREKLAEKFHMSEELLSALNPGQKFDKPGELILVMNVTTKDLPQKAARIEIDKSARTLKAFDRNDELLAFHPVTVGSTERPAPSGRRKVTSVSKNPTYRYNPDYAFPSVRTRQPFAIKPGPNNPVGLVWIALSEKGYGIHGTPEPSKISKSESHGCVRLTNWNALQLASMVRKGTQVDFIGSEEDATPRRSARSGREAIGARRRAEPAPSAS
jgi:lipoprotein-anchoring transpeptidase ErfK/SrfK